MRLIYKTYILCNSKVEKKKEMRVGQTNNWNLIRF